MSRKNILIKHIDTQYYLLTVPKKINFVDQLLDQQNQLKFYLFILSCILFTTYISKKIWLKNN